MAGRTPSPVSVPSSAHRRSKSNDDEQQLQKASISQLRPSDKGRALLRLSNVYQDYLMGIDMLRKKIADMDKELSQLEFEFYAPMVSKKSTSPAVFLTQPMSPRGDLHTDQSYNDRLRTINDSLLEVCSNREETIDSEPKLVGLVSRLKQSARNTKQDTTLIQFWETLNNTLERLKAMHLRFQRQVFAKLKANCLSFSNTFDVRNAAAERYTQEILAFLERISNDGDELRLLAASYGTQIKTQLFNSGSVRVDQIIRACDTKRFPVLRLFPELSDRFERLLRVSTEWLNRDETFLFDLNRDIREGRNRTHELHISMQEGREQQRELAKSLKTAYLIVRNSNSRLVALENDLRDLQKQANLCRAEKQTRMLEMQRKEGMKEFLEAGMANKTRARFALQYKQMRLLKQLGELEQTLSTLEIELDRIDKLVQTKSVEAEVIEKKHSMSLHEYEECRKQFQEFNARSMAIQQKFKSLQEELSKMEAIRNFKTSPDVIDNFYDRPPSIKLSQSLQRRLMQRKQVHLQPIVPKG